MFVEPGTLIGRYEVHRKLGRGGMGMVYVAHDPVLGRMVAIKTFATDVDISDADQRFAREARSAAALSHPNIVTVYDFGDIAGQPYIVMEYVAGEQLAQLIKRKTEVPLGDKLRWIEELSSGVAYAHRMSVVHRDIKPANLMIDKSGRLKILDFGIARMMGTASNTSTMLGTPGYMAPEQIKGESVDHRADVFAMGVVIYELMAMTEAFPGDVPAAVMHRVLNEEPTPLLQIVPHCHPELAEICERALRKNPAERFDTAAMMRDAISRLRNDLDAEALTIISPTSPSAPMATAIASGSTRPGTDGEARRTPGSGPRRTDREALARRRAELLSTELANGRALLDNGNIDGARDACLRALAIDESNENALAFERDLDTAAAAAAGAEPVPSEPDVPSGAAPDQRIADTASADGVTILRPSSSDDHTVLRPARHTPAPRPATDPGPIRQASSPAAAPSIPAADAQPRTRPATSPGGQYVGPRPAVWRSRSALLGIAGIAAVAVTVAGFTMFGGSAAPPGTLVVDAVPWAIVTSVETDDGTPVVLPTSTSTPLSLSLPAGAYRVVLTGPPPESKRTVIQASVTAHETRVAPATEFLLMTPDQYFDPYLGSSVAPAVDAASGTEQQP